MYSNPIPGSLSPQQVWFFRHAGYLRVGNAIPKERLLWLREVIDDLLRGGRAPCERSSSGRVVRISDLASRDPGLLEEFSSPAIVDPLESLLGPNIDFVRNRHNHATVAVEPSYRSRLHRDILQWSRNLVSVIVYLDDCTETRSATRVIRGSQLFALVKHRTTAEPGWTNTTSTLTSCISGCPSLHPLETPCCWTVWCSMREYLGSDRNPRRVITLAYTSVDELLQDEDLRSRVLVRGRRLSRGGSYS